MGWIYESAADVTGVVISVFLFTTILVLFTRIAGLRTFSKMSSFDFAITVAFGSLLATTVVSEKPHVFQATVALAALFALQFMISWTKSRSRVFSKLVNNEPIVLMTNRGFVHDNLRKARVTEDEIRDKLRSSNVLQFSEVKAVIFETTGEISILHGSSDLILDPEVVANVRDKELITNSN